MRFGSRARSIKNKPKVNREYTVPELKKLLESAQNECEILQARVNSLESMLQNNGIELPSDLPQVKHTQIPSEVGAQLPSMTDELQEKIDRIDILESQLEKERNLLTEMQKQIANIKEELQITEQRHQMLVVEKAQLLKNQKETQ